jgi:alanine dehydrogenase
MFGSGWMAQAHLECLLLVRPQVEEVRVYSPTAAHREEFARTWSERTGRKIANPVTVIDRACRRPAR